MKSIYRTMVLLLSMLLLIGSCAGTGAAVGGGSDVFAGQGRDESLLTAMNKAKMDAVRNAVIRMIGAPAEDAQSAQLQEVLYSSSNPNRFVYPESMETLRKENMGSIDAMDMLYEIRIRVRMDAVRNVLDTHGISSNPGNGGADSGTGEMKSGTGDNSVEEAGEVTGNKSTSEDPATAEDPASTEERQFVRSFLENMTYMVYFSEEGDVDPFLMKAAVTQANAWLANNGYRVVDSDQIEDLKADAELLYEEQTGGSISLLQWIAQRLDADVYVEIDASLTARSQSGSHYGKAIITMKMYETSTAALLGSIPYTSPETYSASSTEDALSNALQSSVYQAMPYMAEQSRLRMNEEISDGVRYNVTFINSTDSRLMSSFRRELRDEVEDLETVSQTGEETRYAIYYFGRKDEVEDLIYRVADRTPGMEYISLVLTRGKSMTFDTGLLP
ncbi:DUF6175 family protein [Salinispira pacifica]|uniref:Lipoprotein n=1 Tax=Salinispira pacifica TaxID=1307761 RepID=V5WCZ4_9SPIO|nr:DUF6175 family protein [Salinispira pacifica]AHC13688.1 hypothetical protein L21SP2_0246 [Salinispira pacifica]